MTRFNKIGSSYITKKDIEHVIDELQGDVEFILEERNDIDTTESRIAEIDAEILEIDNKMFDLKNALDNFDDGYILIHEDAFEDYAMQLANDAQLVDLTVWPATCIDWNRAVRDLQSDYTVIEILGHTYYVHS